MITAITQTESTTKPLYLLDQNIANYFGTRPSELFLDLSDVLPIDSKDDDVLEYATNNSLTVCTKDLEFIIKILLQSKSAIFQTKNNDRFYFKVRESKIIQIPKKDTIQKILGLVNIKRTSYIADSNVTLSKIYDTGILRADSKIRQFSNLNGNDKIDILIDYAKKSKSVIVTQSKYNCIKSLFALNQCVFVDEESNLNYLSVDHFKFESVAYNRKKRIIRNYESSSSDVLHNNIRFIRNNIDEIEKNLNFLECELIRRKELEATTTKPKPSSSTSPITTKELINFE